MTNKKKTIQKSIITGEQRELARTVNKQIRQLGNPGIQASKERTENVMFTDIF